MSVPTNNRRQPLLDLLKKYIPIDERDAAQRDRIRAFVEENATCFERSNQAGHITGSAWLVDKSGRRVLLTHHKKLEKWLQLGGHADGDADALGVAKKEAEEESGLSDIVPVSAQIFDVDVHPIPAYGADPAHFHYDIRFAFRANGTDATRISNESKELRWVDVEKVGSLSDEESLLRMAEKWRRLTAGAVRDLF